MPRDQVVDFLDLNHPGRYIRLFREPSLFPSSSDQNFSPPFRLGGIPLLALCLRKVAQLDLIYIQRYQFLLQINEKTT